MGVEAPRNMLSETKHQVISLWNCCIWLVNLFELCVDTRTCQRQTSMFLIPWIVPSDDAVLRKTSWNSACLQSGESKSGQFYATDIQRRQQRWKASCKEKPTWCTTYSKYISSTSTFFGCIYAHHQEVQPYVYNSWYLLCFLDDCLLSWLDRNCSKRYIQTVVIYIRLYLLMMGLDTP